MTGPHRVVLIDDEVLARRRLRQLLALAPDFDVVGECGDAREAADLIRTTRPSIAFLDVQMPHLDGFAVEAAVRSLVRQVVFVTAHPEHAARAFDVAASDYLVKPVTQARFDAALDRIRSAHGPAPSPRILLGGRRDGSVAQLRDVHWVEARGSYVVVHTATRRHLVRASLDRMLTRLGPGRFVRIHRSALVNLEHVTALCRRGGGLEVAMADGHRLTVSRRQAAHVASLLDGLPDPSRSQQRDAARADSG
ncbi:MAG: LytTR family DNA-binding domain-containing protein [Gemmatimonadales bacterium]|nr:LytTR family DNA-binding domain-containing protein [Gemmatimonadales bacterium]